MFEWGGQYLASTVQRQFWQFVYLCRAVSLLIPFVCDPAVQTCAVLAIAKLVLHADVAQRRPEQGGLRSSLGIFATGVVHGCNPDALFVIIPALTLPTKLAAMTYTVMFVLGTVGAMGGYTALIGK